MNPRQRRGVLLMAVATLGALAVFVSVLSYVASVRGEVGELTPALRLSSDVTAFEVVDEKDWDTVQIPKRWLSKTALTDGHRRVNRCCEIT